MPLASELVKRTLSNVEGVNQQKLIEFGNLMDALLAYNGPAGISDYSSPQSGELDRDDTFFGGTVTLGLNGSLQQGTGSVPDGTFTGLRIWRDGDIGRLTTYNAGVVQVDIDTQGRLSAGAGSVLLNADGISILWGTVFDPSNALNFVDGSGNVIASIYSLDNGANGNENYYEAKASSGRSSQIYMRALSTTASADPAYVLLQASQSSAPYSGPFVRLRYIPSSVTRDIIMSDGGTTRFDLDLSTGQLKLPTTGSGAGLVVGGDVQWYRNAADVWRTPDGVIIDNNLIVSGGGTGSPISVTGGGGSPTILVSESAALPVNIRIENTNNAAGSDAQLAVNVAGASAGDPYVAFTVVGAKTWAIGIDNSASDGFAIAEGSTPGINDRLAIAAGGQVQLPAQGSAAGLLVGGDVQWYRDAADQWRTPDSVRIEGAAAIGSAFGINTAIGLIVSNGTIGEYVLVADAGTTNQPNVLVIRHDTSGTPAAGFGVAVYHNLETTTTLDVSAHLETTTWVVATHASRTARHQRYIWDTTLREYMRAEASGTAAMIGFLGAAAVVRQTLGAAATDPATTQTLANNLRTAMINLGLGQT